MTRKLSLGFILLSPLWFSGCVGTQNALMTSSTGLGIDIDSKPPHMDIAFSRREIAIEPAFEGGQTLPANMSFKANTTANPLKWLGYGIGSTFSTGKAAMNLTRVGSAPSPEATSTKIPEGMIEIPKGDSPPQSQTVSEQWQHRHELPGPGLIRPLVFGTKTVLGVHVSWDGSTSYAPSELKVGFHRKELAYAPVSYRKSDDGKHYLIGLPSTFAAINTGGNAKVGTGDFSLSQYFATGAAADNLTANPKIQGIMTDEAAAAAGVAKDIGGRTTEGDVRKH